MSQYTDRLLKLIIIGSSGVGKSCILMRYSENTFTTAFYSTIGVDFKMKNINLDGRKVRLQIWDTAGQDKYRTITSGYYKSAHAVLMIFDVTNRDSFESLRFWQQEVEKYGSEDMVMMVVGNKIDLEASRTVKTQEAKEYASSNNFQYMEVSAQSGKNVSEAFERVTRLVIDKLKETPIDKGSSIKQLNQSEIKQNNSPGNPNNPASRCGC